MFKTNDIVRLRNDWQHEHLNINYLVSSLARVVVPRVSYDKVCSIRLVVQPPSQNVDHDSTQVIPEGTTTPFNLPSSALRLIEERVRTDEEGRKIVACKPIVLHRNQVDERLMTFR